MGTIFYKREVGCKRVQQKHPMIIYEPYAPWLSGSSLNNDPFPGVQGHKKKLGQKEKVLENISVLI